MFSCGESVCIRVFHSNYLYDYRALKVTGTSTAEVIWVNIVVPLLVNSLLFRFMITGHCCDNLGKGGGGQW